MKRRNEIYMIRTCCLAIVIGGLISSHTLAGTITFTPVGPTTVEPGTDMVMTLSVNAVDLLSFDAADVIIGSTDATDIAFVYDVAWTSAFSNTTTPSFDVGFYNQDVFVGGNNATSVGSTLVLGTITINTTGMGVGSHQVIVSNTLDNFSRLALAGITEPLSGVGNFQIELVASVPAVSQWGIITMVSMMLVAATLILRKRNLQSSCR